jgi:NAD(P)H-flavin reductase
MAAASSSDPMVPRPCRARRLHRETADTFTLELEPMAESDGFSFQAGQFNMLYIFGVGEVPISISGDASKPRTLVHTTRVVGSVTGAMGKLKRGDALGVRGPFGSHWPVEESEGSDLVLVAGGIGLAPLRPVLYGVLARRKKYNRVTLLYGTRTPTDILYSRELERWRSRFDLDIEVTVDRAMESWQGNVGVVTKLIPHAPFDPRSAVAMICGPEVMMRFTVMELEKRGLPARNIFVSMERNMKCAVGFCGHCQFGPTFICKDGPVFCYDKIRPFVELREV